MPCSEHLLFMTWLYRTPALFYVPRGARSFHSRMW